MDILGAIKSVFIDEYKFGVERQSQKPVVYVDVNQIDQYQNKPAIERLVTTINQIKNQVTLKDGLFDPDDPDQINQIPQDLRKKLETGMAEVADIVRPQLEEFHPGLTSNVSNAKLTRLLVAAFSQGPFSDKSLLKDQEICVINGPNGSEIDPDHLIKDGLFGLAKGIGAFNPEHLRPLPGDKELWDQLVGEHEGEHCNQPEKTGQTESERDLQTLDGEIKSDRVALKSMRDAGHTDVAQAWVDIRIISTAEGDNTHASSLFIEDGADYTGVTQNNLDAAKDLRNEMNRAVQTISGLDDNQTEQLRKKDPQKYADYLEEQIKTGDFPVQHRMSDFEIENRLTKEIGIEPDKLLDYPTSQFPQLLETYKNLEQNGEFQTRADNPELLMKMSEQYVGATRRLFVENTTPKNPIVSHSEKTSPDTEETPLPERLKENADLELYSSMDRNVAKKLGISEEQAYNLNEANPDRYMTLVEGMLKDGTYDTKSTIQLSQQEISAKVAGLYGVEQKNLSNIPYSLRSKAEGYLQEKGETSYTANNPYLIDAVKKHIEEYRGEPVLETSACPNSPFAENAGDCTSHKPEAPLAPEKVTSLYIQPQNRMGFAATV